MSFRPTDGLLLACLGAAFAGMACASRGSLTGASAFFLLSYVLHALRSATAPARHVHRFGAELADVVALVAFSAAPALILYAALSIAGVHWLAAAAASAVPLATGAVRLALHSIRPRGDGALATGLPRAQSALFAVALCFTSFFDAQSPAPAVALALVPLVSLLNVLRWPFVRPFARPLSPPRFVLTSLAALTTLVGFSIGYGFDVVFAWATLALVVSLSPSVRRMAAVTEQRA